MRPFRLFPFIFIFVTGALAQAPPPAPATDAVDLAGLWKAHRNSTPFVATRLIVSKEASGYRADILGGSLAIEMNNGELVFALPDDLGSFRGKLEKNGNIVGYWIRGSASPVILAPDAPARWSGTVTASPDELTFFLLLRAAGPNTWTAVLRNPERDFGSLWRVSHLVRQGKDLKLFGQLGGKETVIATGLYDLDREQMTLIFGRGSFDFSRESGGSDFYPRGKNPAKYFYHPPLALDDGWPTGTLASADIDTPAMERLIQRLLEMPMDSNDAPQYNAVLVARRGKLVFEEYFHGDYREKVINTRSAAKSVTSVLAGAAMHAGAPLALSSPVYQVMNGGAFPPHLEPQKRNMTLEHLLTMSSGYFCDDTNDQAPGNEDQIWDTAEQHPDFWKFTLQLPLATPPGEKSVYCSMQANLALGMVARATKEFPLYSFDRLVAHPMKIRYYVWGLDRAGNPYGGGGTMLRARDFLKFGQLMLNDGVWQGRRILDHDFVRQSISPQYHMRRILFGYLWWVEDFPYKGRNVRAFMALGNGGNNIVAIPELDLVVVLQATNYGSRTTGKIRELVPRYLLPAVRQPGEPKDSPVTEQEYVNPYGRSDDGSRVRSK